jgi:hypothetical protein
VPGYELGIELSWQLQNNDKEGIRQCKEGFRSYSETVINPLPGYD